MSSFSSTLLKGVYPFLMGAVLLLSQHALAQSCTPQGDQVSYGTNNTWIGYIYQGVNYNTYMGYINEGSPASPNFNEAFGGLPVFNTNGCPFVTDTFAVTFLLTKTFAPGNYLITVGCKDGYELSLDGGVTWPIAQWGDTGHTSTTYEITLNGTYNLVFQHYCFAGPDSIFFNVTPSCMGTGDTTVYGTNNVWNGYIYSGMNFEAYKGEVNEGSTYSPNFDEDFGSTGNSTITYSTNSCSIPSVQFSGRYLLQQYFAPGVYTITVGSDDGSRLSLDGGNTWPINMWYDQSYATTSYTDTLNGTYNMVLDYYQDGGYKQLSFNMGSTTLPITLVKWSATALSNGNSLLQWQTSNAVSFHYFEVQRSTDGVQFQDIQQVLYVDSLSNYAYTDPFAWNGDLYYRLAMVDQDGSITYSSIAVLHRSASQSIKIYPTVVENGTLFIASTQAISQARLELFDMTGRRILEKEWATLTGPVSLSLQAGLPAGVYCAKVSDGHGMLAKQLIIVN
jgi:hypothetical protein